MHILFAIINFTSQTSKCILALVIFDFVTIERMTNNLSLLSVFFFPLSECIYCKFQLKGKKTEMIYNPLTRLL